MHTLSAKNGESLQGLKSHVVQSLKDHETLKNAFHTWKKTKVPVAIRSADTGMGIKIPYIERSTVGEIAENFARVRRAAKDDAY